MSPSPIHLVHASAYHAGRRGPARATSGARGPAVTIRLITGGPRPTDALASHAYSIPVVHELPLPLGEPVDDRTW